MKVISIYIIIEIVVKIVLEILKSLDGSVRLGLPKRYSYSRYLSSCKRKGWDLAVKPMNAMAHERENMF